MLPKPVWDILLGREAETTWRDFCGEDTAMARSVEAVLSADCVEDMVCIDLLYCSTGHRLTGRVCRA